MAESVLVEQIKQNAEALAEIVLKGNRVELLKNKDGLLILEVKRRTVEK